MIQNAHLHTPPDSIDYDHEFSKGFTARYVRRKSRQLLGYAGLRKSDQPDIEQELLLEVWRAVPQFDAAAGGWKPFVATVAERKAIQFLDWRRAAKRRQENEIESLDVLVTDADGVEVSLASQMRPEHRSRVTGVYALDDLERTELQMDLETLLGSLSEEERELLSELVDLSQTEVAALRCVSRWTIREMLKQARVRLGQIDEIFLSHLPV